MKNEWTGIYGSDVKKDNLIVRLKKTLLGSDTKFSIVSPVVFHIFSHFRANFKKILEDKMSEWFSANSYPKRHSFVIEL